MAASVAKWSHLSGCVRLLTAVVKRPRSCHITRSASSCTVHRRTYATETCQSYDDTFKNAIENPEDFWAKAAEDLVWHKKWDKVLQNDNPPFTRW